MAFQKFAPLMNIEYTLRVVSLEGTPKQSQFGKDQVMLRVHVDAPQGSAMSDASWYTYPWIVERLQKAGVQAGQPFRFATMQNGNKSELRISTNSRALPSSDELEETDLTRKMRESTAIAQQRRQQQPDALARVFADDAEPTVSSRTVVPMPSRPAVPATPAAAAQAVHTLASHALAGCMIAAIDATHTAIAYAAKKGVPFNPTSQDIQGLASTLFISMSKMGGGLHAMAPSNEQQQLVNGGSKWPQ
jgi:hypothetical protein